MMDIQPNSPGSTVAPTPNTPTPGLTPNATPPPVHPPHVKKAHSFILLYVCILVSAILIGAVYAWQNSQVKSANKKLAVAVAQNAELKKQVAAAEASIPSDTNAGNAPNNPYAGWKTFCDNFSSTCLRYPKDWVIAGTTSSSKSSESFTNATSSAVVNYENPYTSDKQEQVFYIASIDNLTIKSLPISIVGRTLGSVPSYVLVDSSYLTSGHISVGQSISFVNNAAFTTNVKNATAKLNAGPTGSAQSNIKTSEQAAAWFKTDDAKTSLKILQSLYYQ